MVRRASLPPVDHTPRKLPEQPHDFREMADWAFAQPKIPGRDKLVLVALSRHPGTDVEYLASITGLSPAALREAIRDLRNSGLAVAVTTGGYAVVPATREASE